MYKSKKDKDKKKDKKKKKEREKAELGSIHSNAQSHYTDISEDRIKPNVIPTVIDTSDLSSIHSQNTGSTDTSVHVTTSVTPESTNNYKKGKDIIDNPLKLQARVMNTEETPNKQMKRRKQKRHVDEELVEKLMKNEDSLMEFVVRVNKIYEEQIKETAPFMTFVLCGMQSTGKSTIMERFMGSVINIVQDGTGTRCPLNVTCIHDESASEPVCELWGEELHPTTNSRKFTINEVFTKIVEHNRKLGDEDRFSSKSLYLVYKSKDTQNLRFVDTPGIISNTSTGKDCREDIKEILRAKMEEPTTRLCVLLEPKEFDTNPIIDFCDETFGGRDEWVHDSVFLMTKFDKQIGDARTGSRANGFFKTFNDNNIYPHLIMTPTIDKEDLPIKELYEERKKNLHDSDGYEDKKFEEWKECHKMFLQSNPKDQPLDPRTREKIGFPSAKKCIRKVMLEDVIGCIPDVLKHLKAELRRCMMLRDELRERQESQDPENVKSVADQAFRKVKLRIQDYLKGILANDGDQDAYKQSLDDEVEAEEDSAWAGTKLNHYTELEDDWRRTISSLGSDYPKYMDADVRFLGGKQVGRAIRFFKYVLVESIPDPKDLRGKLENCTGYRNNQIDRKDWENAMIQVVQSTEKTVHIGVNYTIKHICNIFKRLFPLALADLKSGLAESEMFKSLPAALEEHWICEYDEMLLELMENSIEKVHSAIAPTFSTIYPELIAPRKLPEKKFEDAVCELSIEKGKGSLHNILELQATTKIEFLPSQRQESEDESESHAILRISYKYILELMQYNLCSLEYHINHYLDQGFKNELNETFVPSEFDWSTIVVDPRIIKELKEVEGKIACIEDTLHRVQHIV